MADAREALLFSDGSLTVFAPGTSMETIKREREDCDKHEDRKECMTKIVMVTVQQDGVLFDPATDDPHPDIHDPRKIMEVMRAFAREDISSGRARECAVKWLKGESFELPAERQTPTPGAA